MQLLRIADAPTTDREKIYRYSRFRAVLVGVIVLLGAIGAFALGWLNNVWIAYYVPAVIFLFLLIYQKLMTARFRPSNWLVRMTDEGLYIQFRSYLNHHYPDQDLKVVFIPYSEIRSAKSVTERQEVPDRDDGRNSVATRKRRLLALELAAQSTELATALDNERGRVFDKLTRGGGANSRYHHIPVRLASPNLLTIEWGVVPGLQSILNALTRHTLVQRGEEMRRELANLDGLTREEQESRLLELAESGDMIGAIKMARQLYPYDLATAKAFVESLTQKAAKPAREK